MSTKAEVPMAGQINADMQQEMNPRSIRGVEMHRDVGGGHIHVDSFCAD